jgi:DNA-directed RNA polymerase specialized sigma24 family protein
MNTSASRKGEWVLTQAAFDKLLALLDADRERAGERYEILRQKLVKFFEWRGSRSPEDHADQTINRVTRKIDEGEEIENIQAYCYAVARLLLMETLKEQKRAQTAIDQLPSPVQVSDDDGPELLHECFEKCLGSLPPESRELIIGYYQQEKRAKIDRRKEQAAKLGIPLNALRIRAHRIRAKLEECVGNCVKQSAAI